MEWLVTRINQPISEVSRGILERFKSAVLRDLCHTTAEGDYLACLASPRQAAGTAKKQTAVPCHNRGTAALEADLAFANPATILKGDSNEKAVCQSHPPLETAMAQTE
jgi:hypothetical protein